MRAPSTGTEFLELVRKSRVVDRDSLDAYLDRLASAGSLPAGPRPLARALERRGLLTRFQADQLLAGKWRRFIINHKYKLLERLGSGGMSNVYLCEHLAMRRRLAIKVLPAPLAEMPGVLERFYREARAVAALDHPNIVRAHDIDHDGRLHFIVMEYVDGASLHQIVKEHGPLDIQRAAHYTAHAAAGLQHAHEVGLVHRDVKPGNILVDRTGRVKLLDMGLARFFLDEQDDLTRQQESQLVLGTADYLAPEQALDSHGVDIRADIYSLGVTFYFVLTGVSPFRGGSLAQKLIRHQVMQPDPIRSLRPEVPEELAAVLARMMAKDPARRHQCPAEVVEELAPWTRTPIAPPPAREMPQLSLAAQGAGRSDSSARLTRHAAARPGPKARTAHANLGSPDDGPASPPPTRLSVRTALADPPDTTRSPSEGDNAPAERAKPSADQDTGNFRSRDTVPDLGRGSSLLRRRPTPVPGWRRRLKRAAAVARASGLVRWLARWPGGRWWAAAAAGVLVLSLALTMAWQRSRSPSGTSQTQPVPAATSSGSQ
jgi:serine/threonine protein kinase